LSVWAGPPLVVGHRGGRGEGWPPENTLAAFERARREGARAIELDIRTCAGGKAIVFHDETLGRMTGERDSRRVSDVRWEELRGLDLGGGASVPALSETLVWARGCGVAVNVEMKHDVPGRLELAREAARAVDASGADVLLSSFDPLLIGLAAALAPSLPRALLTHKSQARWADALQEAVRPPLLRALHVERTQVHAGTVARFRRRGLRVGVWTVNDPEEARELVRLGVGSIITDRPGDVLRALDAR
jgi:glycerophosphoryl diester phosphodiesterase